MRNALPLSLFVLATTAQAQEANPAPATPEACFSISSDAQRLICYDNALGRKAQATREADAIADYASVLARGENENQSRQLFKLDSSNRDAIANAGKGSLLDSRWELAKDSKLGTFQLRGYKPLYVFPVFATSHVNETPSSPNPRNTLGEPMDLQNIETKFQISFKTKIVDDLFGDNGDLWVGYTQSSRWQTFNSEASRPFRETNYEPELILAFRNNYSLGGWRGRMTGIAFNHQSNGRGDPLSRSWNRVMLNLGLDRENWALVLRPWWRVPDNGSEGDDNPDIEDYLGRGDAMLVYNRNGHEFSALVRHNLDFDSSHGALQLDYGFPIDRTLRGHVQLFHGYGESMIDYNHKATYIGIGVSLLEWF